jgi:glycosyltransferase involved in cell wall biosynthesis
MSEPKVSVFITVFNEAELIERAVRSLLNQTLENLEILVVDDGSDDGTGEVVESINDPRLRLIRCARMGRAAALAFACSQAKGCYLANLDADDTAYPQRLEHQALLLDQHPDHAWVGCGEEREDSQRHESFSRIYPLDDADIRRMAAKCIPYCHSAVMFRRSLLDEGLNYDPAQPFLIDFEFFLRVAARHKVANLPEPLVKRYVRDESYFQSRFSTARQNRRLALLCARAVWEFGLPPHYYLYPLARLIYPWLPNALKRRVRGGQGLVETHE